MTGPYSRTDLDPLEVTADYAIGFREGQAASERSTSSALFTGIVVGLILGAFLAILLTSPGLAASRTGAVPGDEGAPRQPEAPRTTNPRVVEDSRGASRQADEAAMGAASSDLSLEGTTGFALPSYGPRYLAVPWGPGVRVRICSSVTCLDRVSNDAGPALSEQRKGRVADVSFEDFRRLCGGCDPWQVGRVSVVITRVGRAAMGTPTLPPTDTP